MITKDQYIDDVLYFLQKGEYDKAIMSIEQMKVYYSNKE